MTFPTLMPRSTRPGVPMVPEPQRVPTHIEWAAFYPEIERLYVHERRKLRYVMQYMEREHGLKATTQMYKKRFTKWGFHKNSRQSVVATPAPRQSREKGISARAKRSSHTCLCSLPASLRLNSHDRLMLTFLTNVKTWSAAFFEMVQTDVAAQAYCQQRVQTDWPSPERTKDISLSIKLVADLLSRGEGTMAGRMARKAFLLVEEILALDGPALMWNLLEIMHYMVVLHHEQLFQMLVTHLLALVKNRVPETHPLPTMLCGLREIVISFVDAASSPDSATSTTTSSSPSSSCYTESIDVTGPGHYSPLSQTLSPLIHRAWTLNAEILFERFDPGLFELYFCIQWDTCTIGPPKSIISAAHQWFKQIEAQHLYSTGAEACGGLYRFDIHSIGRESTLEPLSTLTMASPLPEEYEMLRDNSIAALRKYGRAIFDTGVHPNGDTTALLRILAGLVKAEFLDEWPSVSEGIDAAGPMARRVQRVHASNVACAIKTLIDINPTYAEDDLAAFSDAVESMRSVVTLMEYGYGEVNPAVVREMWLLQDALLAADQHLEARQIERSALSRLEKYIEDIPVDTA
ncbi:uncharacterized protein HMPREF1541_05701 [Cyphellophora europaea CBS 101466]|uniref:Clr5 domain-containing protein n=1 Tax=Cyphellophora europaea (strain CBS 101466) TaxID=1220924 RepID=W2RSR1_CYPE1|nr:uncharacterized protein HMPREF1541_05701 [Cyphellophora europaea CBS 101466]ETN39477.1 hypothetical protein HMPREF1541_05701 [Cyphellophora europaea CBS 101466]